MHGIGAGVVIEHGEHRGRIIGAVDHAVVRGIRMQPTELFGVFGVSVLDRPRRAEFTRGVADHVQQGGDTHDSVEQFWFLRQGGTDEKAAVGTPVNAQLLRGRPPFGA